MSEELAAAAHHAAGRVVAALALGSPLSEAGIGDDGSSHAEPPFEVPSQRGDVVSPDERALIEDEVVQLFAGAYAEERFGVRAPTDIDRRPLTTMPTSDWFSVALSGRTLDSGEVMDALSERARGLVRDHWDAITAIAGVLLHRGRITRAEAARLVDENPTRSEETAVVDSAPGERA